MKTKKLYYYIRNITSILLRSLQIFVDLIILYFLAMYIGGAIVFNQDYEDENAEVEIFLISNGIHLDIGVPYDENWKEFLSPEKLGAKNYRYISFGWGDKNFFLHTPTWADLKLSVAFYGTFIPSPTAMHVTYYRSIPRRPNWLKTIKISKRQYQALCAEIKASFKMKENQRPILIDCCRYSGRTNDFYEGTGSYHFINTCNEWANTTFKRAGLKSTLWAPFDRTLLGCYE